ATTTTLTITVNNGNTIPTFNSVPAICSGDVLSPLPTTSQNGITGSWAPTLSNTSTTIYTFTPDAGQCATTATLTITVNNGNTIPTFNSIPAICAGDALSPLPTTSQNGITGSWSPALSNTSTTIYTFTPDAGQCATTTTLTVTVNGGNTIPTFSSVPAICSGGVLAPLPTTSQNGITGSWSPALNNTSTTIYTFTPTTGQCATTTTLTITVNTPVVPAFSSVPAICSGDALLPLPTTSQNGISGSWSPALNNASTTIYTFTPTAGQCATTATLTITVNTPVVPAFNSVPAICSGDALAPLPTTSQNGITGSWSPALNNTSTTIYTFTPTTGQCATTATLTITVNTPVVPAFSSVPAICSGDALAPLPTTSQNGITGSWSPALNNASTTIYTFTPDAGQCATTTTLTITVNTGSTALPIMGANAVCAGETILLSNANAGGNWTSSDDTIAAIDTNGQLTGIVAGTVTITYTTSGSCPALSSKTVTVNALPNPVLNNAYYLCLDNVSGDIISTVDLYCGLPDAGYRFAWTLNGNPVLETSNTLQTDIPGDYTVTATDRLTGCSMMASTTVGTSSIAIASATVGDDFEENQQIVVNVTGGSGQYEFILNDGPAQDSNIFSQIYQGEYDIVVRDKNGCGEIALSVFALNYPHFFTPNGDGYNDYWNISGLYNQPKSQIFIFDRYGKLLTSIRPASGGWDGRYNGYDLPSSDYWFTLTYKNRQGLDKEFKAHFSLKR
ncbi:T9SS type B sorting domain-containing protein, partial [Flavobacterium sp.]|uniref:T9SS type B sorting domain-containing protein n=1 Tax=Flavobacterium sp. TaxID=239 RepID=UPI0026211088